ncbi:MAG: hypothetical protein DMF10_00575 [Verrucomicrobia bacterium]|nr:MAG: hypothetical protein DMF10_00575 [Verrucomicrobiota bacterium]
MAHLRIPEISVNEARNFFPEQLTKHQISTSNFQRRSNHQTPNRLGLFQIGVLKFHWMLELGIWNFSVSAPASSPVKNPSNILFQELQTEPDDQVPVRTGAVVVWNTGHPQAHP